MISPLDDEPLADRTPGDEPLAGEPIVVGHVGGAYGVRGWVHLTSHTDPPANLLNYRPWYLQRAGQWQLVDVLSTRPHGEGLVAAFAGIRDRNQAIAISGCAIGVPAGALPPAGPGEYYWRDLIGLKVVNSDGTAMGVVERLIETGAHDVLVVTGEQERLIPFVEQFVMQVGLEQGLLRVDWMDFD